MLKTFSVSCFPATSQKEVCYMEQMLQKEETWNQVIFIHLLFVGIVTDYNLNLNILIYFLLILNHPNTHE